MSSTELERAPCAAETPDPTPGAPRRWPVVVALVVLVALTYARGALVAAIMPPFSGPDEQAHFDYVQRLAESGSLPVQEERCPGPEMSEEVRALFFAVAAPVAFHPELRLPPIAAFVPPPDAGARATTGCGPAALYPPTYYVTAAAAYELKGLRSLPQRLRAARLASATWIALGAAAALLAGLWLWGSLAAGVLTGSLFALQPMILGASGVVNSDAALFALSACCAASLAALRRRPDAARPLVAFAAFAALATLSKSTFLLYSPWFFLLAVLAQGPRRVGSWWRTALAATPMLAAAMGWGLHARNPMSGGARDGSFPLTLAEFLDRFVLFYERIHFIWVRGYWMNWGWTDTFLEVRHYDSLLLLTGIACVGLAVGWRSVPLAERAIVIVGAAATIVTVVVLYRAELTYLRRHGTAFIQGRYLLPLWPLHAAMLVSGLRALGRALRSRWNPAWALVIALAFVNAAAVLQVVQRYYGPTESCMELPTPFRATMAAMGVRHPGWPITLFVSSLVAALACAIVLGWERRSSGTERPAASPRGGGQRQRDDGVPTARRVGDERQR